MSDNDLSSIQRWLAAYNAGDESARARLIEVSQQRLSELTHRMFQHDRLRRWEDTDDVLQEGTLRLHSAIEAVRPQTPRAYFALAALQIRRTLWDMARHYFGPHGIATNHDSPPDPKTGAKDPLDDAQAWDLERKRAVRTIRGHRARVQSIAYSSSGETLATSALDGTIKLWDVADRIDRTPYLSTPIGNSTSGAISPGGRWLAAATGNRLTQVGIWDTVSGVLKHVLPATPSSYDEFDWSRDERYLGLGANARSQAEVWDINAVKEVHMSDFPGQSRGLQLAVSSIGHSIATFQSNKPGGNIHDLATGHDYDIYKSGHLNAVSFFPDGKTLACIGFADGDVHLYSIPELEHRVLHAGHESQPQEIAIAENAQWIASGEESGVVRVVRVDTGKLHRVLRGHEHEIKSLAISSQGTTVASGDSNGMLRLWHVESGETMLELSIGDAHPLQMLFTPNDTALMCWTNVPVNHEDGRISFFGELYVWSATGSLPSASLGETPRSPASASSVPR